MKIKTEATAESDKISSAGIVKLKKKAKEDLTAAADEESDSSKKKSKKTKQPKKVKDEDSGLQQEQEDDGACSGDAGGWKPSTDAERQGDFKNYRISSETVAKLRARNVNYLFPIQAKTFDYVYDGEDLLGQAQTGTGKTLSFALPLVEKIRAEPPAPKRGRLPLVIVMVPTRELAKQVADDFTSIGDRLSVYCIYGGVDYGPQERAFRDGLDVLVGTPGRILDHVQKGTLDLTKLKHVVLDEVDRMLDLGFTETVEQILQSAYNREGVANPQTLLFSATVPPWVKSTSKKYMRPGFKHVDLIGQQSCRTATTVQHLAIKCSYRDRAAAIGRVVQCYSGEHGRAMVFCQTKRDADELAVSPDIKQASHVLHGDVPQTKREIVLKKFREGSIKCLVTTDVAARGLDVPEVDLVVQCSPPKDVDSYIHRSGRTGRAGRTGVCVLFFKPMEEADLRNVERIAGITFKRVGPPTVQDIINNAADDAERSLEGIPEAVIMHFRKKAEELVEKKGAVEALASALAVISGTTEVKERSLLSSAEDFVTYIFRTNIEIRGPGYVWKALEKCLGDHKEEIKGMRMCKDKKGCVFDVPITLEKSLSEKWVDGRYDTLQKATELPELVDYGSASSGSSFGNGYSGGARNGYSGSRNGFTSHRGRGGGFGGNRRGGFTNGSSSYANRSNGGSENGFSRKRSFGDSQGNGSAAKRVKFD